MAALRDGRFYESSRLFAAHCRKLDFGDTVDRMQSECVRISYVDTGLYPIPEGADEEAAVMPSNILPTGFECGALNGKVHPGRTVAIVGSGPVELPARLTSQLYSPAEIIMIDLDDNRSAQARRFGGTACVNIEA